MINLKDVDFDYGIDKSVFRKLNLEMFPGHIYGLLGKNGAGKTTLLKIMSGLLSIVNGKIETMGFNPKARKVEMLQELYFLPEELYIPALTVKDFVRVYAPFYPNFNREQFDNYLEMFEFEPSEEKLHRISYGQKKKVLISFGLAANTKMFLLDEPTNGLDIPSKAVFRKIMASAVDESRLVVISTHQVRDLHSLIDAVVILDNGAILLNHSVENILDLEQLFNTVITDKQSAKEMFNL